MSRLVETGIFFFAPVIALPLFGNIRHGPVQGFIAIA